MLPSHADAVPHGRHLVAMHCRAWGLGESDPAWPVVEDMLLMVSELVGNAIRLSSGPIGVNLEAHRTHMLVAVRDDNPEPASAQKITGEALGGRGLKLVSELSVEWGQTAYHDAAKQVWAKVQVPDGSVLAQYCAL